MCQVTTAGQVKTHDAVMRIEQGSVDCKVGWTAACAEGQLRLKLSGVDMETLHTKTDIHRDKMQTTHLPE